MGFSLIGRLGTRGTLVFAGGVLSSVLFSIIGGPILFPFNCFPGRFFGAYIYIYIYTKRKQKKGLKVFNSQRAKGQANRYTLALCRLRRQPPLQSHH